MTQGSRGWALRSLAGAAGTLLVLGATPAVAADVADAPPAVDPAPVEATDVPTPPPPAEPAPAPELSPAAAPEQPPAPEDPGSSEEAAEDEPPAEPEKAPEPPSASPPAEPPSSDGPPTTEDLPDDNPPAPAEQEEEPSPAPEPSPSPMPKPKPKPERPAPSSELEPDPATDVDPAPDTGAERPAPKKPKGDATTAPKPEPRPRSGAPRSSSPPGAPRSNDSRAGSSFSGGIRGLPLSTQWPGFIALSGMDPSEHALDDIPEEMLDLYRAATLICPGLPWTVLAGVGKVETDHGRNLGVSSAGARGPMQFLPSTWQAYGLDGNGDGFALIDDPEDAVYSAAAYLCSHGGGDAETLPDALYAYNHAWWYVDLVLRHADRYRVGDPDDVEPAPVTREALLDNPNLVVYPAGGADIALGRLDPRVLDLLALLTQQHEVTVVALQTGHSKYIAGTNRVSNHFHGRAVDIAVIDGEPVNAASPRARALVLWLASLTGPERPSEVGSPFADLENEPGHFSNAAHMGHVHVGWGAGRN